MNLRTLPALLAALSLGVACSSSPDIPDDAQAIDYRSTQAADSPTSTEPDTAPVPELEASPTAAPEATGPVAIVDGAEISADTFNLEMKRVLDAGMPLAMAHQLRDQLVQKLVDQQLIRASIRTSGITIDDAEFDAKIAEIRTSFAQSMAASGQEATLEDLLQSRGISMDEFRDSVRESMAIERILGKRIAIEPTDAEIQDAYQQNIEQFQIPETVDARHILIVVEQDADDATWVKARVRADEVRALATADGADFAAIAREHSEGPSAPDGGNLGTVPRGRTVPEFEKAAFALEPGQISEPVRTSFGWHIIKSEGHQAPRTLPLAEVRDKLAEGVKGQKTRAELDVYLAELRDAANVELKPENLR